MDTDFTKMPLEILLEGYEVNQKGRISKLVKYWVAGVSEAPSLQEKAGLDLIKEFFVPVPGYPPVDTLLSHPDAGLLYTALLRTLVESAPPPTLLDECEQALASRRWQYEDDSEVSVLPLSGYELSLLGSAIQRGEVQSLLRTLTTKYWRLGDKELNLSQCTFDTALFVLKQITYFATLSPKRRRYSGLPNISTSISDT